jgi:predicted nucleic acid-binding protein
MRGGLVVDASAAVAWLAHEPEGELIREHLRHERTSGALYVPSLFWLEVANALDRGQGYGADGSILAIRDLDALEFETVGLDRPLLLLTIGVAHAHGLVVYDAVYLALAQALDASLLTVDRALFRAAGDRAVTLSGEPGRRLSEDAVSYGTGQQLGWPDYSIVSELLARLRAEDETQLASLRRARHVGRA